MEKIKRTPMKPDTGLVWGILTTIFCCLPFGIIAIVKATQVDTYWASGLYEEAYAAAKSARQWALISAAIPFVLVIIYILLIAIGISIVDPSVIEELA
ncbi:MAG: CD225/dispanin family protein [Alistipes sp.]|nr:CD225/dispanin family protein [Alistipes sp.]MBQ8916692.1 CD225/dispanin family protein [Alistipes sp.]